MRSGQITAITHCTLLTLDEPRFIALLSRNAALREAVMSSAEKRGVTLDLPGLNEAA